MLSQDMLLTLSVLARRPDDWECITPHLSLTDLGRLRSVSSTFRDAVTPGMMERAALGLIRREEGEAITAGDLSHFRFHPATREWVDAGLYATACVASLHHVCREAGEGGLRTRQETVDLPGAMHRLDLLPQLQDGRAIAWHIDPERNQVARHLVGDEQAQPFLLPAGLVPYPHGVEGLGATRSCVLPLPAWLLLGNPLRIPSLYCVDTGVLIPLPLPAVDGRLFIGAASVSRRFVATTTWVGQGESLVRCYDRTQDCLCVDALLADCRATQVSVANDGKVFVGTPLGGHVIAAGGDVQVYPDPPAANGERLAGTVFRLSPDERFLIRPGPHSGSLLLEDLRDGRHVILPRMEPLRPGQQCLKPASIAFSVLNALAAVAYQDGLILVFDLLHEDVHGACQLTRAELRCPGWLEGLSIRMDGFDRVQTLFAYRSDAELPLGRHTLCLGRA